MAKQSFTTGSVLTATQMNNLQANDYNWTVSQKTASYVLVAADAGTRIEMNSAGATTVTVNTGLFTAGDTLFIQNIGAGACTVTAGTATVNKPTAGSLTLSQYQGGTLYFISASSAVFFADAGYTPPLTTKGDLFGYDTAAARIPIGSNNQVLTADSTQALGLKWATPSTTFVGVSLYKSANQSINDATATNISFDSEDYDTNTFHDNTTNNERITIPSGQGGKYLLTGSIYWAGGDGGTRATWIYKNASTLLYQSRAVPSASGGQDVSTNFAVVVDLVATDYVYIKGYQTRGSALNATGTAGYTFFQATKVG